MDGYTAADECIPIRLYLSTYHLTPTLIDIEHAFSVRYYIKLVMCDNQQRRFFKECEITLQRSKYRAQRAANNSSENSALQQSQSAAIQPSAYNKVQLSAVVEPKEADATEPPKTEKAKCRQVFR